MQVTSGIQCNLLSPSYSTIYAPQGDAKSRFVLIQLLEGAAPWEVPSGASVIIRAAKPDGTFCFYDTNEAGESAYAISGSTVTIELVGQVLAAPGPVLMQIDFYNADGAHLSTFTFCCQVSESVVSDDDIVSSNYFSVLTATLTEMQQIEQAVKAAYGAPLVAATAAAMTDHTRVYVYTGSESGYTNGNWYYWDGSAWASGGVYNSSAVNVDSAPTQGSTNPVSSGGTYTAIANEAAAREAANTALSGEVDDLKSAFYAEVMSFAANTALWESGTINGNTGNKATNTTRIRTTAMLGTDVVSIKPINGFAFAVYAYDKSGTYVGVWNGSTFEKTTTRVAWISSEFSIGNYDYSFKIAAHNSDNTDVSASDASNILFGVSVIAANTAQINALTEAPVKVRFMQYNIGKFNMGLPLSDSYHLLSTDNYATKMDNYKELLGDIQPDMIGFEEFEDSVSVVGVGGEDGFTASMDSVLFDRFYPNAYDDTNLDITSHKAVRSKYPILDAARKTITANYTFEGVSYSTTAHPIYGHAKIAGKTIGFIVNAFPNSVDNYPEERNIIMKKTHYQMAVDLLQNDEYAFIICDANTLVETAETILTDVLIPAGYNSAMGSYFPWHDSWMSATTGVSRPLDNIYYKTAKTQLVNFKVLWSERELSDPAALDSCRLASDHAPVYADFLLF